jgi:hypothetical protein
LGQSFLGFLSGNGFFKTDLLDADLSRTIPFQNIPWIGRSPEVEGDAGAAAALKVWTAAEMQTCEVLTNRLIE